MNVDGGKMDMLVLFVYSKKQEFRQNISVLPVLKRQAWYVLTIMMSAADSGKGKGGTPLFRAYSIMCNVKQ